MSRYIAPVAADELASEGERGPEQRADLLRLLGPWCFEEEAKEPAEVLAIEAAAVRRAADVDAPCRRA